MATAVGCGQSGIQLPGDLGSAGAGEVVIQSSKAQEEPVKCVLKLGNLRLSDIEDTIGLPIFQEIFVNSLAESCGISRNRIKVNAIRAGAHS